MQYIDYNTTIRRLSSQIINSHEGIDITNPNMLFDYYRSLFVIRHNLLHYFCLNMLKLPWEEESKIKDKIKIDMPKEFGNKTPDIILKGNECYYIIDVSISHDIHKTEKTKLNKYKPIVDWLCENGVNSRYIHVNVTSDNSNLETEIGKLRLLTDKEFEYIEYFRFQSIIVDKKEFVSKNIDKEFFEEQKRKYYLSIKDKTLKETFFRDELLYINMGNYLDIEIDKDVFENYNSNYTHIDDVKSNVENFNEDLFIDSLKELLENNNEVYHKYSDEKLENEQFENAKINILEENEKTPKHVPKPVHHLMLPVRGFDSQMTARGEFIEQETVMNFMDDFLENFENIHTNDKNNKLMFINDFSKEFKYCFDGSVDKEVNKGLYFDRGDYLFDLKEDYKHKKNRLLFITEYKRNKGLKIGSNLALKMDLPFNRKDKDSLKKLYNDIIKNDDLDFNKLSFRKYLKEKEIIKEIEDCSYVKQNKIIRICKKNFREESKNFYKKTGIGITIADRKLISIKQRTTVDHNLTYMVDDFLRMMIAENEVVCNYKINEFLVGDNFGNDSEDALKWKKESVKNYEQFLSNLQSTNCYQYSMVSHNCYKQLLHATQFNTGDNTFYVYNCGIKNMLIIVALSYTKTTNDEGKPFMSIIKTKNPEDYTNFFGKIYKTKIMGSDYWYVYTNWRRLNLAKITYMCDSHYSVLSSTMNTALSSPQSVEYLLNQKIEKIYSLRTMISYATSQKVGELLMDTRYAYMSAFSIYTNIQKLLIEKFGTVHINILEMWIVKRLLTRLPLINKKALTDGITQNRIEMDDNVRDIGTIGGVINLPSLWCDYQMKDITELLDEAFIYVHTMKEPANIFHENIKAIKTIVQFQNEFDSLPENIKKGSVDHTNFVDYLMYDTKIGCSTAVIYHSVKHTVEREKPFFKKIIHEINDESISELISTKAVIKSTKREVIEEKNPSRRDIEKKAIRRGMMEKRELTEKEIESLKFYYLKTDTNFYNPRKMRQKVMETIMEYIKENPNMTKTVHMANHFIKREGGKVLADICIKAQYGAKREFYVVNMGAKSLARLTENFFKKMSMNSPNEAISIPGDDKIIAMQKMLDRIYFNPITPKHKIMYVNGDCTKWSAAETMASFIAMTYALRDNITEKMYNVLLATFNSWSNKKIQVPMDIFNKVIPNKELGTGFLKKLQEENITQLDSTQNFLQGMFNYASSYKAVCCNNYTIYLWNKIYPETTLIVEHMEHSDDYVLVILYENREELEKFRALQKIVMRLHGYNDSDRKTSCQPFLMEFVSQMSFNGVMLYPQIKKSKEVNLSLPCIGYKQDMEAALSRVGECARVGCNQSFLYFFQRLHTYRVADAYSVLPGGVNSFERDYKKLLNDPIELFGIPDILPIFSLYCRGNGNNYRLYNYGTIENKYVMRNLYLMSKETSEKEDTLSEDHEYEYSLQTPRFLYEIYNRTMKKFRGKLGKTPEEIQKFWQENITYKLIKPRDNELLIKWIEAMYYNRTFLEAYTKVNRTMMTMRLSRFVKNKIIKPYLTYDDYSDSVNIVEKRATTMKEYYYEIKTKAIEKVKLRSEDENMLRKIITKCDPTYGLIYSILEKLQVLGVKREKTRSVQVALKTPFKLKTLNIMNSPGVLLQYLYNKENFIKDKRTLISKDSLDKDVNELRERIPREQLEKKSVMSILSVYNDLMISKEKRIVMFGYNRHVKLLLDSVLDIYTHNFLPGHVINLYMTNVLTVRDPINDDILYTKGGRLTKDFYRQCIDNICLIYVWLKKHCGYSFKQIVEVLDNVGFRINTIGIKEEMGFRKILKMVSIDHMSQYHYSLDDKKIVSYLKVLFQNDYEPLDELTNTVYSFSYNYLMYDKLLAGEYRGKTHVNYTYFNTSVEAYYEKAFYKNPIIMVNKYYQSVENVLYNIGMRLTGQLSQVEFEKTINQNRLKPLKLSDLIDHDKFFKKMGIKHVVRYYGELNKVVKITNITHDDYILPIFIVNRKIQRQGTRHLDVGKIRPSVNEYSLSVMLGKSKIYTLPFWKCEQFDNMIIKKDIYIDEVHLKEYLSQGRLKKYLMNNDYLSMPVIKYLNPTSLMSKVFEEIRKHKLYEYDLSKLVIVDNDDIKQLLKNEPKKRRLNIDKKILEKGFLEPKGVDFDDFFTKKMEEENKKIEKVKIQDDSLLTEKERLMGAIGGIDFLDEDIGSALNENAFDFDFMDDFLVELDDVDIIPLEEDHYDMPTYYNKELQNIVQGSDYLSDVFIVDPMKRKYTSKAVENQGYLVKRIENLRSFYIKSFKERNDISKVPSYMSLGNFVENLQNCINLLKYLKEKGRSNIEAIFTLEKLLCNTYITNHENTGSKTFRIINNEITPCIWTKNKYTTNQLSKIRDKIIEINDDMLLIEINIEMYMKRFEEDRKSGVERDQKINVSVKYDNYLINVMIEMMNQSNSLEEQLDDFLFG